MEESMTDEVAGYLLPMISDVSHALTGMQESQTAKLKPPRSYAPFST